jgi:hypothetical protein
MKIDELIEHLNFVKKHHGNARCFLNMQHGSHDQIIMQDDFIYHARADLILDGAVIDIYGVDSDEPVVVIAGH